MEPPSTCAGLGAPSTENADTSADPAANVESPGLADTTAPPSLVPGGRTHIESHPRFATWDQVYRAGLACQWGDLAKLLTTANGCEPDLGERAPVYIVALCNGFEDELDCGWLVETEDAIGLCKWVFGMAGHLGVSWAKFKVAMGGIAGVAEALAISYEKHKSFSQRRRQKGGIPTNAEFVRACLSAVPPKELPAQIEALVRYATGLGPESTCFSTETQRSCFVELMRAVPALAFAHIPWGPAGVGLVPLALENVMLLGSLVAAEDVEEYASLIVCDCQDWKKEADPAVAKEKVALVLYAAGLSRVSKKVAMLLLHRGLFADTAKLLTLQRDLDRDYAAALREVPKALALIAGTTPEQETDELAQQLREFSRLPDPAAGP